jgi:hypothetical protein
MAEASALAEAAALRDEIARCRRLSLALDEASVRCLERYAADLEARLRAVEAPVAPRGWNDSGPPIRDAA